MFFLLSQNCLTLQTCKLIFAFLPIFLNNNNADSVDGTFHLERCFSVLLKSVLVPIRFDLMRFFYGLLKPGVKKEGKKVI